MEIVPLARPQQCAVRTECDRRVVVILGGMGNSNAFHGRIVQSNRSRCEGQAHQPTMCSVRCNGSKRIHPAGCEAKRFSPNCSEKNLAASWPLTLFPDSSSGGEKVASPHFLGTTATIPPLTPLLPGNPVSYSQSPEFS